jgi:hypothetical protein
VAPGAAEVPSIGAVRNLEVMKPRKMKIPGSVKLETSRKDRYNGYDSRINFVVQLLT